jgi:hypothetical protein
MTDTPQAYPLQWPETMARSPSREKGRFQSTLNSALKNVTDSLRKFGTDSGNPLTNIVLSSNCSLGNSKPNDPGVAAWFSWAGESICIPVDRYTTPEANLQAIHHIIEARRVELRHGTLQLVRATMNGFKALPPPAGSKAPRSWAEVLGLDATRATKGAIEAAYRERAKTAHPDAGGSAQAMHELNRAKAEALA